MPDSCKNLEIKESIIDVIAKRIQEASSIPKYSFYLPHIEKNITKDEYFSFELYRRI